MLEQQNQFERAAAIAVFHLDIRRAVLTLKRAIAADLTNESLRLVAMALAGYGCWCVRMWRISDGFPLSLLGTKVRNRQAHRYGRKHVPR